MTDRPDYEWFEVRHFEHEVIGIGEPGHFEDVKSFLVIGEDLALLIDTGMGFASIRAVVEDQTDRPVLMVNSHGHLDHTGDNWRFERRWAHEGDLERIRAGVPNERMRHFLAPDAFNRSLPDRLDPDSFSIPGTEVERTISDGDEIHLGGRSLRVLHTPGHSAGSVSFWEEATGILIAGDAIYEGPMFAHHQGGSPADYRTTLQRLRQLVPHLSVVYPSHNRYPLEPSFVVDSHGAMEEIWNGRKPDSVSDGLVRFDFPRFSFTFSEGWEEDPGTSSSISDQAT